MGSRNLNNIVLGLGINAFVLELGLNAHAEPVEGLVCSSA